RRPAAAELRGAGLSVSGPNVVRSLRERTPHAEREAYYSPRLTAGAFSYNHPIMKIGLTYDLRSEYLAAGYSEDETAEFDRESTVEGLENALIELGHQSVRIGHARQLMQKLVAGEEWDLVLNIAEGMCGIAREVQVPAILDVYGIPY